MPLLIDFTPDPWPQLGPIGWLTYVTPTSAPAGLADLILVPADPGTLRVVGELGVMGIGPEPGTLRVSK